MRIPRARYRRATPLRSLHRPTRDVTLGSCNNAGVCVSPHVSCVVLVAAVTPQVTFRVATIRDRFYTSGVPTLLFPLLPMAAAALPPLTTVASGNVAGPTLVFIHGWPDDASLWDKMVHRRSRRTWVQRLPAANRS